MTGKTSGLFRAIATFIDSSGSPVAGDGWIARVSDQDALTDDCLGESGLDANGKATFLLSVADIKSMDSPGERQPDLCFTLSREGVTVFRSHVIPDVDFESLHHVSGEPVVITREFGPFQITLKA